MKSGVSLLRRRHILKRNPRGNERETFPLPNDPDRETITADLQGTSKLDFHLDLCLRLSNAAGSVCVCEKLQFCQRVPAMRAFELLIESLVIL